MKGAYPPDDRGPWFELGGHPVHAPLALAGGCIVSMLVTTAALAFNHDWENLLKFSSSAILERYELWRVFSFALWNRPNISLALELLMLWWFGRELEVYFGRRIFLKLCAGILFVPALAGILAGLLLPVQWVGLSGSFALFIAFATMAPEVTLLFGVSAKWTAAIFLGIQLLSCAASHSWGELTHLTASTLFSFGFIRYQQGRWEMPRLRLPGRRPKLRLLEPVPKEARPSSKNSSQLQVQELDLRSSLQEETDPLVLMDPLLEKIARSGLGSLTSEERTQLERAREALLRREPTTL